MATELIAAPLYCLRLLFEITLLSFVYPITILIPYSLSIMLFFGPLKSYFKNEAAACKITRYCVARHIEFAWSKVASLGVGVRALSQRVFVLSAATKCLNISSPFLIPAKL
jgi:hypothetical protein